MNQRLVSLAAHVSLNLGFPDIASLFLPRWMLCIFLNCFPADATVRVWDVLFMEALVEAEGEGRSVVVAHSSSSSATVPSLLPSITCPPGPGGAGPRFLVEMCLALMSSCAEEIELCDNFPDAVEVLKDAGSRMRDVAELLALTKLPNCSLSSAPMGVWRLQCAPELLHEALGGKVEVKSVQPSCPSTTAAANPSGSPSRRRAPPLLSSRGSTGLTPPPVAIGSTLERIISPLSVASLARITSPLSPRFRPISSTTMQSSAAPEGGRDNQNQSSSFSSLQLGDLVALASTINPSLASSTLFGASSSLAGSKPSAASQLKRKRESAVSGGETSLALSATAFASSVTSAVKHFATDASRLASSLSSKIITAYSEFDADAMPLPSSPLPSGAEAVKRARRHETREGGREGGGALMPIQLASLSVGKGDGAKKGEAAVQLSLLSPPRIALKSSSANNGM